MNVSKIVIGSSIGIRFFWVLRICSGPILAIVLYLMVPETLEKQDGTLLELGNGGKITAALAGWMVIWWVTEALPLYITALLPLILLPISGQQSIAATSAPYGHPLIYLALGGFVLAAALEKWHLHKKFAHFVIGLCGSEPRHIVAGFMIASAMLSMWISNVATAIIMLPVAMSIINLQDTDNADHKRFAVCLLLSICYSCSVGDGHFNRNRAEHVFCSLHGRRIAKGIRLCPLDGNSRPRDFNFSSTCVAVTYTRFISNFLINKAIGG